MLREKSVSLRDFSEAQLVDVLKFLSENVTYKHPIRDYVKFFVRMTVTGVFSYAREKSDLGTDIIPATEIVTRLRCEKISEECLEGLSAFEATVHDVWPLLPGSNSWVQLEVLISQPKTVVMGRIVRLSSLGSDNITTTKQLDNITTAFNSGPSIQAGGWTIAHANLSKVKTSAVEDTNEVLSMLLRENSDCDSGFYMYTDFGKIRVVGLSSPNEKDSLPVPFGALR